jgi:hypothetical protein
LSFRQDSFHSAPSIPLPAHYDPFSSAASSGIAAGLPSIETPLSRFFLAEAVLFGKGKEPAGALCLLFFRLGSSASTAWDGTARTGRIEFDMLSAPVSETVRGVGRGGGNPGLVMKATPRRWRGSLESNLAGRKTMGR